GVLWSVQSAGFGETDEPVIMGEQVAAPRQKGNGFTRALKAPFKAIGKLFGGGKDDNRLRRMTEKDAKKFESAGVLRVNDALTPVAPKAEDGGQTGELLSEGRALLNKGMVNESINRLSRAASEEPQAEVFHLLGIAYDRKGLREMASESYERALKMSPNNVQILNDFGYSLYRSGHYEKAVERLKRAAKYAPNNQRIWNNLGLAQSQLGKYDDACKSFVRARGELEGRLNVAALLERAGRDKDAIKHYEAVRRLAPVSTKVLQRLVVLYHRTGKSEEAEEARRALAAITTAGGTNVAGN
ncbi:MAG: tetratricopeptide repeat protein, partial [Acidobacteriota bacterium]|nr:tetratricopeptide repeat protein [Acidobacteriota bacterium]